MERWRKEDGGFGAEEMTEGTNAGNSTFIPYRLLNVISTPKFMFQLFQRRGTESDLGPLLLSIGGRSSLKRCD